MAGVKIVTRKMTTWHGRPEEWTNVYYFGDGGVGLSPSAADATALINGVINAEKPIHRSQVLFLGGAAYKIGAADTPGDTDAISVVELVGSNNPGTSVAGVFCNPEMAVDIKWLLGGRRYLRSMLHTCSTHGLDISSTSAVNVADLSAPLKAFAEKMLSGPWVGSFQRIAPNGDRPGAILYNPFLEHRQFHRYRRREAATLG